MHVKYRILASLAAVSMIAVGCAGGPAAGSGASVVDDDADAAGEDGADGNGASAETQDAQPATDDADSADAAPGDEDEVASDGAEDAPLGTRDHPLAVGTQIEMGDWTLAVVSVDTDATAAVVAENTFNDPPEEGRQFVMFEVEATYVGEDSGNAWIDFSWAIVGAAGNTFGTSMDDHCGVIPDSLSDTGETFPGGQVSGNECVAMDADQIEGATIRVEETFSFGDTRAFYALN